MNFIAFDTETTGTMAGVDRIVELGAVRFVNGEVDGIYSTLVNPLMPIPEGASRVNGITNDMVQGKPTIDTLLESFSEFCGDLPMVAHNSAFDTQFLVSDYTKHEIVAPKGLVLCTLAIARKVFPGLANYRLGTLVQHLNIPSSGFHRAEEDAKYCGQLFIKSIEKMTGSLLNPPPLENLISLTGKPAFYYPKIERTEKQLSLL